MLAEERQKRESPVLIAELAKRGNIPLKFLEAILLELKNNGILESKKGKGGGYTLARKAEEIHLGEVIRILEGPLALLPCVSKTGYQKCEQCEDEQNCGIRAIFKELRDATAQILDHTSLAKVLDVQNRMSGNLAQMYFI